MNFVNPWANLGPLRVFVCGVFSGYSVGSVIHVLTILRGVASPCISPFVFRVYLIPDDRHNPKWTNNENKRENGKEEESEKPMKAAPTSQFVDGINYAI